jgi:uncharacterized membrane protein YhaH (DUF805 family)
MMSASADFTKECLVLGGRMTFVESVLSGYSKYATFAGRARRSEYWWFTLFTALILGVGRLLDTGSSGGPVITVFAALAVLLPAWAVSVRRLHDTGRSGWWLLVGLIPILGIIVLIVFACQPTLDDENLYGPPPPYYFG